MNLGEPFYTERGKITGPYTYEATGTLENVGKIINSGLILTTPIQGELIYGKGQGVMKTEDGSETATYTFQITGSFTDKNRPPRGAWFFRTDSKGKLSILNNLVGIVKGEMMQDNEFVVRVWKWT